MSKNPISDEQTAARIREAVQGWPPLSDEQRAALSGLLGPGRDAVARKRADEARQSRRRPAA